MYLRKQSQPNGLPEPCDYDVDCGHWNQAHDGEFGDYNVNIHISMLVIMMVTMALNIFLDTTYVTDNTITMLSDNLAGNLFDF